MRLPRLLIACATIITLVALSGCAMGIPDADTGIPKHIVVPCEVPVVVDGRRRCMQQRELDEILGNR